MTSDEDPNIKLSEKVSFYLIRNIYPAARDTGLQHFIVPGHEQGKFMLTGDGRHKIKLILHLFCLN